MNDDDNNNKKNDFNYGIHKNEDDEVENLIKNIEYVIEDNDIENLNNIIKNIIYYNNNNYDKLLNIIFYNITKYLNSDNNNNNILFILEKFFEILIDLNIDISFYLEEILKMGINDIFIKNLLKLFNNIQQRNYYFDIIFNTNNINYLKILFDYNNNNFDDIIINNLLYYWENLIKLLDKNNNDNNNITDNDKIELLKIINNIILKTKNDFKKFANVALYQALEYLTDNNSYLQIESLNVIKNLIIYCDNELIPLKNNIIEFLNVLKNDDNIEIKSICEDLLLHFNNVDNNNNKGFHNSNIFDINEFTLKPNDITLEDKQNIINDINNKNNKENKDNNIQYENNDGNKDINNFYNNNSVIDFNFKKNFTFKKDSQINENNNNNNDNNINNNDNNNNIIYNENPLLKNLMNSYKIDEMNNNNEDDYENDFIPIKNNNNLNNNQNNFEDTFNNNKLNDINIDNGNYNKKTNNNLINDFNNKIQNNNNNINNLPSFKKEVEKENENNYNYEEKIINIINTIKELSNVRIILYNNFIETINIIRFFRTY